MTKMIENPPKIDNHSIISAIVTPPSESVQQEIEKINHTYEYWSNVKYRAVDGYTPEQMWTYVKASRLGGRIDIWKKYGITLFITNQMQRMCHEFDMYFGGSWSNDAILQSTDRERYLVSSLMEESIFSSQMEGASTTRIAAKDMLRKKITPKDKSQQMIANNYQTIRYVVEHKKDPLTSEGLCYIHRLMTENTLENQDDAGRFRTELDDVVVEEKITHEVVHTPPSYQDLPEFINDLCDFFNNKVQQPFVHPIIRGIIIHFMISYMHPFVDGNGRTARALFYWYMLQQDYWLMEYMSISRVIAKSKNSYEKSFLYTECDEKDLGYFVAYNLRVLELAFRQLKAYIVKKQDEKKTANNYLRIGNINERQAQIIQMYVSNPREVMTVKDVQTKFSISPHTAKMDIIGLVNRGILKEFAYNLRKKGYLRGDDFEAVIMHQ